MDVLQASANSKPDGECMCRQAAMDSLVDDILIKYFNKHLNRQHGLHGGIVRAFTKILHAAQGCKPSLQSHPAYSGTTNAPGIALMLHMTDGSLHNRTPPKLLHIHQLSQGRKFSCTLDTSYLAYKGQREDTHCAHLMVVQGRVGYREKIDSKWQQHSQ